MQQNCCHLRAPAAQIPKPRPDRSERCAGPVPNNAGLAVNAQGARWPAQKNLRPPSLLALQKMRNR
eukprot:1097574-Lingulodinium_polyedra.AAC.1